MSYGTTSGQQSFSFRAEDQLVHCYSSQVNVFTVEKGSKTKTSVRINDCYYAKHGKKVDDVSRGEMTSTKVT